MMAVYATLLLQTSWKGSETSQDPTSTSLHQRWNFHQDGKGCMRLFRRNLSRMFLSLQQMQITKVWTCLS
ncbi:unnamed protein product [Acanthoscelides obtectus]|uniref:Uncharacterized protein n=1 Tax=Acanthoscelides obtectus TaxID=200917 RepID=A0A9P0KWC9_ACAOB|nr:unnamed protein product [Acanthoscelides obtectus]CAK1654563.1 hypothetical protein AOBTE_LOCUS18677 [Acanthoscelides obtectus]